MNSGESPPGTPLDIANTLRDAGIGVGPVENSRRLVPKDETRVLEFYSRVSGSRLVALPRDGVDGQIHEGLRQQGMPVLPTYEGLSTDLQLLFIPEGTWPLGMRLHIMRRDFGTYSAMLLEVARSQRLQYEQGMGVVVSTPERRTVDHFAFTPNLRSVTGQQLYMVPPYNIDYNATPENFATAMIDDLRASGEFDERQMGYLQEAVMWEVTGDEHAS